MKYSIAYNFDKKLISYYRKINTKKDFIFQVFFSSQNGYLGSGRYRGLPNNSLKKTGGHFKYLKGKVETNYLLNSSYCPDLRNKENLKNLMDYLFWVYSQKPSIVTVANKKVLTLLKDNFPDLPVNISIIMAVKTVKQVNQLRRAFPNIKRITLHQKVNRDKDLLVKHVKNANRKTNNMDPIEIELLANEICIYNCPLMKRHYFDIGAEHFGKSICSIDFFLNFCPKKRASDPIHFLNSCFIRPEDVVFYEGIGIHILKLSGREASSNYLKLVSKAYLKRKYSGNVMDLFDSLFWPEGKVPFMDNRNLDSFLKYLWEKSLKKLRYIPKKYYSSWKYNQ